MTRDGGHWVLMGEEMDGGDDCGAIDDPAADHLTLEIGEHRQHSKHRASQWHARIVTRYCWESSPPSWMAHDWTLGDLSRTKPTIMRAMGFHIATVAVNRTAENVRRS